MQQDLKLTVVSAQQVVDNGFCTGCGACAFTNGWDMALNEFGEYIPVIPGDRNGKSEIGDDTVCPSLAPELNEDVLAAEVFSQNCSHDERIGYHYATYGAYVCEGVFRSNGTSGGMGTWVAVELLRKGHIDGFIHVKPIEDPDSGGPFFEYAISRTESEILEGAKTRYHVIEMSKVMARVKETPGSYLFIGVPCFVKAVRRLQRTDPILKDRIKYLFALVCGHLKSVHWTLSLAWSVGVDPKNLKTIQYRTKAPEIPSRAYVFRAFRRSGGVPEQHYSSSVVGGRFNQGALMLNACDFCDDVVGETADLTIGDAWLPQFDVDTQGTNLLVVRHTGIDQILQDAYSENRISLTSITPKEAGDSQSGGFRQRREGLSYRLAKAASENRPVPVKRISPGQFTVSSLRRRIYDARSDVAIISRKEFKSALDKNDFNVYILRVFPAVKRLRALELRSVFIRSAWGRVKRYWVRIMRGTD